jgi:hypothetical protein
MDQILCESALSTDKLTSPFQERIIPVGEHTSCRESTGLSCGVAMIFVGFVTMTVPRNRNQERKSRFTQYSTERYLWFIEIRLADRGAGFRGHSSAFSATC